MKFILTVIGSDKPGIIAKVSTLLAENTINIEDISQTIMQKTFTMIMLIDSSLSKISQDELRKKLETIGEELGVSIHLQHQAIFDAMHKI